MDSFGYLLKDNEKTIYYSGDSCEIPNVISYLFKQGLIHEWYQDTCWFDFENNSHLSLDRLNEATSIGSRNRIYCMHLDETLSNHPELVTNLGFNIVPNEQPRRQLEEDLER